MISIIKKILNRLIRKSYWYNNILFADCAKFWNHSEFELDVINLGSTSARSAFVYDKTNLKACNWAMSPQTFVGDLEILRNYSCYLKEGATVIIPLCPLSCLGGFNLDLPDKYYTILNIASIPNASLRKKEQVTNVQNNPFLLYPLFEMFNYWRRVEKIKDFSIDANMRLNSWKHEFSIMDWNYPLSIVNRDRYNDSRRILSEIIEYCYSRGFKPVVVLPPVSRSLSCKFNDSMRQILIYDFIKYIEPKVRFLDYFEDIEFNENSLFSNSFILNRNGAVKFTSRVLKDLSL